MSTSSTSLTQRMQAEFAARDQRLKAAEKDRAQHSAEREARLKQFATTCEQLQQVWKPRLEEFARQFGEKIKVTPSITPAQRSARMDLLTDLANVTLTLTVSTDAEVRKLVLEYDLLIIPMLMEYERHARMETPLDKPDTAALGAWIEDRLIACVKTYLSLQDNEFYLKRAMVEDPISKVRFLPDAAAEILEYKGSKLYFASPDTLRQFKEKVGLPA